MTRVLVYYPSRERSVALETMILALRDAGIEIELLTTGASGPLHDYLRLHGIPASAHPSPRRPALRFYVRQALHLIGYCRRRKIDVVLSHLQEANIIAVFARFVMQARVITFRHHFTFVFPGDGLSVPRDRNELIFDRIINRLSETVVVPAQAVADGMQRLENLDPTRLKVLPYIYDFAKYESPEQAAVDAIRSQFPAQLTLLMVSRLVPLKRPELALLAVRDLIREGYDIRLLVLGDGPERASLDASVVRHGLGGRVVMLGHRAGVVNYMAAADLLVHPSLTEASCNAVKEMALVGKPSIVAEGVGDFGDYIEDGRNGFIMPRRSEAADLAEVIRRAHDAQDSLTRLGEAVRAAVLERFGVSEARVREYLELLR